MPFMIPIHFSAYIIYTILCLAGYFLIRKFIKKDSLFIMSIVTLILAIVGPWIEMFNSYISLAVTFMPIMYFCLALTFKEQGDKEANRLFFILLGIIGAIFVVNFIMFAYIEEITWMTLGTYISFAVAFICSAYIYKLLYNKFSQNNFLSKALPLAIVSVASSALTIFLQEVFLNVPIGDLLLAILYGAIFSAITSFALVFVDLFLDKDYLKSRLEKVVSEEQKQEKPQKDEEVKQEKVEKDEQEAEEKSESEEVKEEETETRE